MKIALTPTAALLSAALLLGGCASLTALQPAAPRQPITINLVALNDFHGNLEPSKFTYTDANGQKVTLQAGGIDAVAAAVNAWRQQDRDLLLVGAGDLVGASPALSSMWADEPTIHALNLVGLNFSSVGNHEFDSGRMELLRQQHGGCVSPRPAKACKFAPDFKGAQFTYMVSNVVDAKTGKPFLPAWHIADVKGVKIAFLGAVVRGAADLVLPSGIEGLSFEDEADSINKVLPAARAAGATVFVVLIHEGGQTKERFDQPDCQHLEGPIVDIAKRLDPAIRLVVSGHTHKGYQCKSNGRFITQAETAGHVLSRIALSVDPATRTLQDVAVKNVIVKPGDYPSVPAVSAYLATVKARSDAALQQPVARVAVRSMTRELSAAGESALGDLVADAVLDAAAPYGAQIGFMNTAGMRKDFDVGADLRATFGQAQIVLPFGNTIVLMDLTGAQLYDLLEHQWEREKVDVNHSMLQVSNGFAYRWDGTQPRGARVIRGSMTLNGQPIDEKKLYRVAANNFLAEGGDGFPTFREAANSRDTGIRDIDAFTAYLQKREQAGKPAGFEKPQGRFERVK
ncbi:bifunctional metallophosphatase/5'-nucleotidase [Massilia arenosa]|uniref:Bifunctional metallophosphatase/5'-nucleotidase n=1 Tax=Zemynaea arenosa TaxID=2561931 RepID=A0A4Y9SDB6_9BURK|nr:bifunctional metallophosphatase/5'-nucleotidase [Massilia arenosa]